jgi:hypothetical protein
MDMKNVKNANFLQVDHQIKNILQKQGVIIIPSPESWEKFQWVRKFFKRKPKEGYFVWVKKQISFPITTCVAIASPRISQDLKNFFVVEENVKIKANILCEAAKNHLYGIHKAQGIILIKEGAGLEYEHFHKWGEEDFVNTDYEFILEKDSRLVYSYKNLFPPKNLSLKTKVQGYKNSSSNLTIVAKALNSKIDIKDNIFLRGEKSQAIVRLRLVGERQSQIQAVSKIFALSSGKGHLDCQGLLVDKEAKISLIPQLVCKSKEAQITHEASIGKINEEQLTYLRMRGLTEIQAIDLITNGFLKT